MTLDKVFQKLSYTHLSELAISGHGTGQIVDESQPLVIMRINEGLMALYARFALRRKTLTLRTYEAITEYFLRPEFALNSGSAEDPKYIIDTVSEPFPDDILMITDIINEDGETLAINDRNNEDSWHFNGFDALVLAEPEADKYFVIRYIVAPEEIDLGPGDPKLVEIVLPRVLEPALMAHVAGHIYGNMSMEGAMAKSQHFLDMYENECKIVEERNLFAFSISSTNTNPAINGWP